MAYASDIRHLQLDGLIGQSNDEFPWKSLTGLRRLLSSISFLDPNTLENLSNMIRVNQGLLEFQDDSGIFAETQECMNALSRCPNLKKLSVKYADFERTRASELFFNICTRLEELEICYSSVSDGILMGNWSQFPSIRSLRFEYFMGPSTSQILEFIQKCPQLESLYWSITCDDFPVSEVCQLPSAYCPRLTYLTFRTQDQSYLTDHSIAEILNGYPILTGFSINESEFGPLAFQSLCRHFSRLKALDLGSSPNITSLMVQKILTACQNLRSFHAPSLEVGDIFGTIQQNDKLDVGGDGGYKGQSTCQQEWVCVNLCELKVLICGLGTAPAECHRKLLQQLAKLERLEILDISHHDRKVRNFSDSIDMRLDAGLDILKGLKRLQVIGFNGLLQSIDDQEINWVLKEWPNLRQIRGVIHPIKSKRRELVDILVSRGVEVIST
ncbi:hypothetical protein BGZ46_010865 [Entomortierella lignicola]|nr:hypothetical protein BGZ46_010865 [Entomortierella lignicola]